MPFPDVPFAPGVPQLPRDQFKEQFPVTFAPSTPAIVSKEPLPKVWGIFSDTNKLLLQPDNILSVKDDEKTKVSNFPVEEGAFASYNKVKEPFNVKVMMTKGGTVEEVKDFLSTVRILKDRTSKLVSVVTPEDVFLSATLEGFDYSRETGKGQNLIHVLCHFLEVRQVSSKYASVALARTKTKNPASSSKTDSGHVAPKPTGFSEGQAAGAAAVVKPVRRP